MVNQREDLCIILEVDFQPDIQGQLSYWLIYFIGEVGGILPTIIPQFSADIISTETTWLAPCQAKKLSLWLASLWLWSVGSHWSYLVAAQIEVNGERAARIPESWIAPRTEAAILTQTAASVGEVLLVHWLQPFKWPEQQSRTAPVGKCSPKQVFLGWIFPPLEKLWNSLRTLGRCAREDRPLSGLKPLRSWF